MDMQKMSFLLGLLLSDGSVYYDKTKRTYCIQFTNKSKRNHHIFKSLIRSLFHREKFQYATSKNVVSVRFFSKKIADTLFSISPTFRTLSCFKNPLCNGRSCLYCKPVFFNNMAYPPVFLPDWVVIDNARYFLSAYMLGDGNYYENRKYSIYNAEITCFHPILLGILAKSVQSLEIKCRIKPKRLIISGISNYTKFMELMSDINILLDSQPNCPSADVREFLHVSNIESKG